MRKALLAVVFLLLSVPVLASKTELPDKKIPDSCGVAIHFHGNEEKQVKQIAEAGFGFVRMDIFWFYIEKEKGVYDWTPYDQLMDALDKYGVRAMFIVAYGNQLYSGSENDKIAPASDEYRKAYAAFAGAAAKHFKGRGIIWEIWNEPNTGGFWQPAPDAKQYVAMAKEAYAAIKKADPGAVVIGPTCYAIDFGFLDQTYKLGLLDSVDVVSVHPYGHPSPEAAIPTYEAARGEIKKYGKSQQVVSSEWGYSSAAMPKEQQAQYLIRMYLTGLLADVPLSVWYDWHDDGTVPTDWQHNFGVVHNDFTPKPGFIAMQTLTKNLKGCSLVRRVKTARPDEFVLVFSDGKTYKLAAWTSAEPHQVSIPVDAQGLIITDMYGKRKKGVIEDKALKMELNGNVAYIECPYDGLALDLK